MRTLLAITMRSQSKKLVSTSLFFAVSKRIRWVRVASSFSSVVVDPFTVCPFSFNAVDKAVPNQPQPRMLIVMDVRALSKPAGGYRTPNFALVLNIHSEWLRVWLACATRSKDNPGFYQQQGRIDIGRQWQSHCMGHKKGQRTKLLILPHY